MLIPRSNSEAMGKEIDSIIRHRPGLICPRDDGSNGGVRDEDVPACIKELLEAPRARAFSICCAFMGICIDGNKCFC